MFFLIVSVLVSLLAFCIFIKKFIFVTWHNSKYFKNVPEPPSWPLLGHSPRFFIEKDHQTWHVKNAEKFRSFGAYRLRHNLFGFDMFFVTKPEWGKYILSKPDLFPRGDFFEKFFPLLGKGLLVATGDLHRFQKKILSKAFSSTQLQTYIPVFDNHTKSLVEKFESLIKGKKNGENISVREHTSVFSFNIIAEIAFGYQFDEKNSEIYLGSIKNQVSTLQNFSYRVILQFLPFLKYLPYIRDVVTAEHGQEVLNDVLLTRKEKVKKTELTEFEKKDILSIMMTEQDEKTGEMFSDQLIKDSCFTFMLAGYETTATAIPIVLYHLSQHPEMQERAYQEISGTLPSSTETLQFKDLELPYLTAFIKESLRMFPTVPGNARRCAEDVKFGDYLIPKGTVCFLSNAALNRDPELFDYPDEFIPERFLPDSGIKGGTILTFGYGPMNCIGKSFAMLEMKISIARLLQKFVVTMDTGYEIFKSRKQMITSRVSPEIHVRFKYRAES